MTIITYPNPILTTPTKDINVTAFDLQKLEKFAKDMVKTVHKADGVGLAAPQVGRDWRICVIRKSAESSRYRDQSTNLKDDLVLVNPYIVTRSVKTDWLEEGCLSLPGINVVVARSVWIQLTAQDIAGKPLAFEASDFLARVIQHEVDHLDGILIVDRKANHESRIAN